MSKIPTFAEFINERLFNKSIDRVKSGDVRKEDITPLHTICENIGKFIAKKLKIQYTPELCTFYEDESGSNEDTKDFFVSMNFGFLGDEYSEVQFEVKLDVYNGEIDDFDKVESEVGSCLDVFQDQMEYEDYKDPYIPSKKEFNKIRKILQQLVDELIKQKV